MSEAIFAAGCFWGVQYYFDQVPGVVMTTAGYIGGHTQDPDYDEVCYGNTGHAEAVLITFDPARVGYDTLVRHFFRMHDPTQLNRQGPDVGDQYRSTIFYRNAKQKKTAKHIMAEIQKDYTSAVVTTLEQAGRFYPAEAYHQKYAERTGKGICHIPYRPLE